MKTLTFIIALAIIAFPVLLIAQPAGPWDSGLKVKDHESLNVTIEGLSDENRRKGLSKELIQAKIELQLRQYGINPTTAPRYEDGYLCIYVNIAGSAYSVDVEFKRRVRYSCNGNTYESIASVWETGGTGIYGRDPSLIIQNLADLIDIFINDYIKANQTLTGTKQSLNSNATVFPT
jgi:hypothetical protein